MKISVNNIKKSFGDKIVLDDISFEIVDKHFIGLLGPNGAGKSTLMKVITGQASPQSGEVTWYNDGGILNKSQINRNLGFVHQDSHMDEFLTVLENLHFKGSLYGLKKSDVNRRINELHKYLDIDEISNVRFANLSGGQKRRVDILGALLNNPKLLILDEPTTGIDAEIRADLWKSIEFLRENTDVTIFLITHYLEEMNDVDELLVLTDGHVKFQGTPLNFEKQFSEDELELTMNDGSKKSFFVETLSEKISVINKAYETGNLLDFRYHPSSLEQAYLKMIKPEEEF